MSSTLWLEAIARHFSCSARSGGSRKLNSEDAMAFRV